MATKPAPTPRNWGAIRNFIIALAGIAVAAFLLFTGTIKVQANLSVLADKAGIAQFQYNGGSQTSGTPTAFEQPLAPADQSYNAFPFNVQISYPQASVPAVPVIDEMGNTGIAYDYVTDRHPLAQATEEPTEPPQATPNVPVAQATQVVTGKGANKGELLMKDFFAAIPADALRLGSDPDYPDAFVINKPFSQGKAYTSPGNLPAGTVCFIALGGGKFSIDGKAKLTVKASDTVGNVVAFNGDQKVTLEAKSYVPGHAAMTCVFRANNLDGVEGLKTFEDQIDIQNAAINMIAAGSQNCGDAGCLKGHTFALESGVWVDIGGVRRELGDVVAQPTDQLPAFPLQCYDQVDQSVTLAEGAGNFIQFVGDVQLNGQDMPTGRLFFISNKKNADGTTPHDMNGTLTITGLGSGAKMCVLAVYDPSLNAMALDNLATQNFPGVSYGQMTAEDFQDAVGAAYTVETPEASRPG